MWPLHPVLASAQGAYPFLSWREITSCSFQSSLNLVAYIPVISHACRQPCPAEKLSAPANFNNKIKIPLMAGKNASWSNLVTRYEITTAHPQARLHKARLCQGHSVGCFRRMSVALNKGPSVRGLRAHRAVCPGAQASSPLTRHHLPASLHPVPRLPQGLFQEVKHIPESEHAKLKSTQPLRVTFTNIPEIHNCVVMRALISKGAPSAKSKDRKLKQQGATWIWFFRFFKGLLSLPSQTMHLCLGHDSLVSTSQFVEPSDRGRAQGLLMVQWQRAVLPSSGVSTYTWVTLIAKLQNAGNDKTFYRNYTFIEILSYDF